MADPFWRARIQGDLPGGEVWSVNPTFGSLIAPEAATDAEMQEWADSLLEMNAGLVLPGGLRGLLSTAAYVTGVRVEFYSGTGGLTRAAEATLPSRISGTGSPKMPITTAVCASLYTARIGRSYRGRIFLPALGADLSWPAGRLDASVAQGFADATADLLVDIQNAYPVPERIRPVVYSGTKGVVTEITAVKVGNVLDNLRGRKDSLAEQYATSVI